MPPLVTVIMPAFNAARTIANSIESVLQSTHPDIELLVVDDQSCDRTPAIVLELAKRDPRVRLLRTQLNGGSAKARNFATHRARGDYIAFCDSDDLWHAHKLERQLAHMQKHAAMLCGTAFTRINDQGQAVSGVLPVPARMTLNDLLRTNHLCCSSVVYDVSRTEKLFMPDYRDRRLPWYLRIFDRLPTHDDYLTWIELLLKRPPDTTLTGLNEPLTYYRVSSQSQSGNKFKAALVRWHIYRNVLHLPYARTIYLFWGYAKDALRRRRLT